MSRTASKLSSIVCVALGLVIFISSALAQQELTPLEQQLPEQEITAVLPPSGGGKVGLYHVWLPEGYNDEANAKRTYPVLMIDVANGQSHKRFKHIGEWVKQNRWICIMPNDVKNGPTEEIDRQYSVIFPDIKNRFRMTPHCGIMTGSSGGSRRATRFGSANQDLFGGIINNAAVTTTPRVAHYNDQNMMVMVFSGVGNYNIGEIRKPANNLSPDRCQIRLFDGGHQWGPAPMQKEAMDWMAAGLLTRFGQPEPVRDLLNLIQSDLEQDQSPFQEYLLMTRFVALAKSQRDFKKDKELKAVTSKYASKLKNLAKDKEFKVEFSAMTALQTIRDQYTQQIGSSLKWATASLVPQKKHAKKVVRTTEAARQQALAALQQLADRYPDTEAVVRSQVDIKAIKSITKHWR